VTVPSSLQWRISLWLGLSIALLWTVAAMVTAQVLRHETDRAFDSALEETAQRLLPLAVFDILGRDQGDGPQRVATLGQQEIYLTYVVRDARGTVLLRSHSADDTVFPPFSTVGFVDTPTHRIYFDAAVKGAVTIAVAEPLDHRHKVAREALLGFAWPLGLLVPLSLLAVFGVVRISMAPLRSLRSGIVARGGNNLSAVPVAGLPSEIRPIADAVNHLLDKLCRALDAERSFTANAAHELRSPVAAALAQTQRLIVETKDGGARERAQQIEAALRRLSWLSEKLMQLAKAEGGRLQQGKEATDVTEITKMVVGEMIRDPRVRERIALDLPGIPILTGIDADAFAIAVRNLIENGLKHGAPGAPVAVVLSRDGVLTVSNDGEPVPADLLAHLARPFERGRSSAEGSGLGLAIANAVASGIGGELVLTSPLPGQLSGFEARLSLRKGPTSKLLSSPPRRPNPL
jgi:two-component system, OmpR family, sensor kinase